jgi:uncharacterized membrane protein YphA (DoxX/SURF4 family)
MSALRLLARPAMAGIFVLQGVDAIRHPKDRAIAAEPVALPLASRLGLPQDPVRLVQINGAVHAAAGAMLAFGRWPRLAAAALLASLVPTTLAGHRFWEEQDPAARAQQKVQFLKNASMAGGLLLAVADTGGRPSISWMARRAARRAAAVTAGTASAAGGAASGLIDKVESIAAEAVEGASSALSSAEKVLAGVPDHLRPH